MATTVRLDPADNVVTAIRPLEAGVAVEETKTAGLIPRGHKIATQAIGMGDKVIKYNQVIGYATRDIAAGEHVHVDECEFRATDVEYTFGTDVRPVTMVPEDTRDTFMGYPRRDGRVGTRNYIALLSSVNCSATACKHIADAFGPEELAAYPNVDGVVAFTHGTGCGNYGEGMKALQNVMWGYARHPNVGGVLMVGLGCEGNQIEWLMEAFGLEVGPTFQWMNIQNVAGLRRTIEAGVKKIRRMLPIVNEIQREECSASELTVALQCGGSDAWSGITANPAVGYASDKLVGQGGTTVLGETPEIYGAEHLLAARANEEQGKKLLGHVQWWEDYTRRNYATLNNNPSPGNKAGGLTTILEKSLGATAKGGTSPLTAVWDYGEQVTTRGFTFMNSPGYDPASVTGQVAGGSNLVVFTTGRGSAFGCKPAPSIKVATNTELATKMPEDMDINAGKIITDGKTVEEVGEEIYRYWLAVASGQKSFSEAQGLGDLEFVPWQIGATL
ncbi:MAG: altronate dehydratase family protein [Pseudomonadota bacterium]